MYRQYPFSEQKQWKAKVKVKETDPTYSPIWLFPVTIPHCQYPFHNLVEERVMAVLIASSDGSFWECPSVSVFQTLFLLFLSGKCLLYTVALKNIHSLKVESYDVFSGNFEGFKLGREHFKLRNLALFYVWENARVWAHWNHSLDMHLSYLGPVSCILISWVSSGFTGSCWKAAIANDWCVRKYSISQILSSWSGFWPIFGRHFMINFCPTALGGSSQIRWKFLLCHSKC